MLPEYTRREKAALCLIVGAYFLLMGPALFVRSFRGGK